MNYIVRIGHVTDFETHEEDMVTLDFGEDAETAFAVIKTAIIQGYVVKIGMGSIDG